ncbi:MAG TPA: hypothetical protein VIQ24_22010 [Pyrinomonadaceae bacterium]
MRIIIIALLLSTQAISSIAAPVARPAATAAAETTRLTVVVAQGHKGAAFLREAKPTLDRLQGQVVSAEVRRNPVLGRDETYIVFSFNSPEASNNFMLTLAGGGSAPTAGNTPESGSNYNCSDSGMEKICYFRFGNYRFVCVQAKGAASGSCVQM